MRIPGAWRSALFRASDLAAPSYRAALREARAAAEGETAAARHFVDRKLCDYLRYCQAYSPFWRDRWPADAETLTPESARAVLASLPTLGKQELREHADTLRIRPEARRPGDGFPPIVGQFPNWSGGSTGIPTQIWQDARWAAANRAAVDLGYRSVGLEPGRPTFFLWGSENELGDIRKSARKRITTWLRGLIVMPAFALQPERMDRYVREIDRRTEVDQAICFVSAADAFTAYLERAGRRPRRLARVVTGGGTLTPDLRARIREHLADEVFDMYGSRDLGMMAMETPDHAGLGVCHWHNLLEVLDDEACAVEPGAAGQIHATALDNYSTALIRFDMGDVGRLGGEGESAWNAPLLRELSGRVAEHLIALDGSRIDPGAVIHLVGVVLRPSWLRKFQMVQKGPAEFLLRMETWESIGDAELESLRPRVAEALERLCRGPVSLELEQVSEIQASPSGKHIYCIHDWDPEAMR